MLNEEILNQLIPIESLEVQREATINELEESGFDITDFENGSPFGTILMIFFQVRIDLLNMLRKIYKGMFLKSSEGKWLDVKAADYCKERKQAIKAEGLLNVIKEVPNESLTIPKGYVFKTLPSLAGKEYRFYTVEKTIIEEDVEMGQVPIIAEEVGSSYNVPLHSIKRSLVHIPGVKEIDNDEGWLIKEGSDTETDDSFRKRTLNTWAELSTNPIALKYKNVAESVEGVLYVRVADMHPRGQGTVDIIVASYAGTAGEKLLKEVEEACQSIIGLYDDLLVRSAETVSVDVQMILYIKEGIDDTGLVEEATKYTREYFRLTTDRELNVLYVSEISFYVRKNISELKGIKIVTPEDDIILSNEKVIILGSVNVSVERV